MRLMCCFLFLCLVSPVCLAEEIFCGKVERFFSLDLTGNKGTRNMKLLCLSSKKRKK
jgi:hypothetical protein